MNGRTNATVTSEMNLRLIVSGDTTVPVPAVLHYDLTDPFAVHASFHTGERESVDWVFARDLLIEGITRHTGEGDVQVWPDTQGGRDVVCISLSSPEGRAVLQAPAFAVQDFLTRTVEFVAPGSEGGHLNVDNAISLLLDGR